MAEVVDSIVAELILRDNGYSAGLKAAVKVADDHTAALKRMAAAAKLADQMMNDRSARGTPGSAAAKEANAAVAEVKKAAKAKTDAEKAAARETAEAVKASEREKAAAAQATAREAEKLNRQAVRAAEQRANAEREASAKVIAAAEREAAARARLSEMAQRAVDRRAAQVQPATSSRIGATVVGEQTGTRSIPSAALIGSGASNAEVEREVNHLLADDLSLRARLTGAAGEEATVLRDQRVQLQLIAGYKRAGLTDDEAALRIESDLAAIARNRALEVERVAAAERAAAAAATAAAERQVLAQTDKSAQHLTLLAPTLVGGITAHELSGLNDEFIKLANSLKVAGVGTAELDQVQGHLLATANRTGTDINGLADLYRSAALASHDLGASQQDLLKVSDAVANALRIGGRSSDEARGAILQLGHAFESGRVTAREFNSLALNLYPILQAVAKGSDQFGGSVGKLRQALLDGDITSKVFFQDLLRGSDDLAARAGAATLTTAQGFTALRNSLIVYFGEADKAQGVSAALGEALGLLARNLDTLVPAIVAVGTALAVGYVVRMGAAAAATENLGGAILTAFGGPVGLTITAVTIALGTFGIEANTAAENAAKAHERLVDLEGQFAATATGAHAAAGGVAGVGSDALGAIPKVNAFAGAVGNLAQQLYNQARAARAARLESLQQQLTEGRKTEIELGAKTPGGRAIAADDARAAGGRGNIAAFLGGALSDARGFLTNVVTGGDSDLNASRAYEDQVKGNIALSRQIAAVRAQPITAADIPGGAPTSTLSAKAQKQVDKLKGDVAGLEQLAGGATGARLDRIKKQIDIRNRKIADIEQGVTSGAANAAEGGGGGRGRRGPSAETLAKRAEAERKRGVRDDSAYDAELRKAETDYLSETADLANDGAARAEIERKRVRFQAEQFAKEIAAKGPAKDGGTGQYTAKEVTNLQFLNSLTADVRVSAIDTGERRRTAADTLSLDKATRDAQREQLQQQAQLADTTADRRRIALQLLDLDYQQRAADLKAVNAPDSTATPTEKQIATDKLKALPAQRAADEKIIGKQNETAGQTYLKGLSPDRDEFIQGEEVKALGEFNRGLDESVNKALHLHGIFGDILGDLIDMAIKQALIKPLAGALFGGGSGGSSGGGIGAIFGSILSAIGVKGGSDPAASIGAGADDFGFSGIPGFATGGSATIGGNPGIDQNILSINGQPSLRVGKGETLTVSPNLGPINQRVASSPPLMVVAPLNFDLRSAITTPELLQQMSRISTYHAKTYAEVYSNAAGRAAVAAAPQRLHEYQQREG